MKTSSSKGTFGPWALVTGASSGIDREFARQIATSGINVVLVARRETLLSKLGAECSEQYGVEYRIAAFDLFLKQLSSIANDFDIQKSGPRDCSWRQEVIFSFSWILFRRRGPVSCQDLGGSQQEAGPYEVTILFVPVSVALERLAAGWAEDSGKSILRRCPVCEQDSIIGHGRRRKKRNSISSRISYSSPLCVAMICPACWAYHSEIMHQANPAMGLLETGAPGAFVPLHSDT